MAKKQQQLAQDPTFAALQVVHEALAGLTVDQRAKVLASVTTLLDVPSLSVSSGTDHEAQSVQPSARVGAARPTGLIELIKDRKPSTNIGKITLFAYYREKHEGQSRFAPEDLKAYFGKALESPPALYRRDFRSAVRKGWLHSDGADSYITSKGIEEVESSFRDERKHDSKAAKKKAGSAKARRKKKA